MGFWCILSGLFAINVFSSTVTIFSLTNRHLNRFTIGCAGPRYLIEPKHAVERRPFNQPNGLARLQWNDNWAMSLL
jgi:hypothetical protein